MTLKPDLSEFEALVPDRQKPCPLGTALAELPPQDAVNLGAALNAGNGRIPSKAILAWAASRGLEFQRNHISRHRAGTCSCHARR